MFCSLLFYVQCRSVRVAERLALPTLDHGVAGSNPAGSEILPEPKRRFIAQSLSCSPFHRLEMTEILLKGRKTLTHPSSIHTCSVTMSLKKYRKCPYIFNVKIRVFPECQVLLIFILIYLLIRRLWGGGQWLQMTCAQYFHGHPEFGSRTHTPPQEPEAHGPQRSPE